jgi:Transposase DDE domain group 1
MSINLVNQYSNGQINLARLNGREVIANFDGGSITSDAGIILLSELDKKLEITSRFASCFQDHRNSSYVQYPVDRLLAQRIYAIALGYEDVNDHDKLRNDPALAIALDRISHLNPNQEVIAGKSTINRLEYCPEEILDRSQSRYHKIEHQPEKIEKVFVDIFLNSYARPPREIILDLEEVRKLVPSSTWFRSINYRTEKSWSCQRRVVTKVCYGSEGLTIHHVVTSLSASKISPSLLHTNKYCPRGEMENRLKEQQLDLFADRTSTQTFESNQLRLWLSSMAYVLMQAFRENCLSQTPLAKSTVGTIRLNLLKIGARITISTRRVVIAIASMYQFKNILRIAYSQIKKIPDPG